MGTRLAGSTLRLAAVSLIAAFALHAMAARAHAQASAVLNHYRAAPRADDGFMLNAASTGPHLGFEAALHLDYANDPLVYEELASESGTELTALVSDQLTANAVFSLGLYDSALIYAGLPVTLVMTGNPVGSQPTATGFGVGDLRIGGRLRLHSSSAASVSLNMEITAPTGEGGSNGRPGTAGDSGATFAPQAVADITAGPMSVLVNFGARWRPDIEFSNIRFTDLLTFGAGLSLPLWRESLRALFELQGESPLQNLGERAGSVLDALLGLKLTPTSGLTLGLAGGSGLLRGYGAPDLRAVAMFGYAYDLGTSSASPSSGEQTEAFADEPEPNFEPDSDAETATDLEQPTEADADVAVTSIESEDQCPYVPGPEADRGCSRIIQYDQGNGAIVLLQPVRFTTRGAALHAGSDAVLTEVAAMLAANPSFNIRIEAHVSSGRNDASKAADLSRMRALTVARWLETYGIKLNRLVAQGCASNRPLVSAVEQKRFKNERIELYVTRPLPPTGLRSSVGCSEVELQPPAPVRAPTVLAEPELERELQTKKELAAAPKPLPAAAPKPSPPAAPITVAVPPKASPATALPVPTAPPPAVVSPPKTPAAAALPPTPIVVPAAPAPNVAQPTAGHIDLPKPIRFEDGNAALGPRSADALDELAAILRATPTTIVAIESYVAGESSADASMALTKKRSAIVGKELASRGIAPSRIKAYGCGDIRPIAPNNVPWGRKKNERIEVRALDSGTSHGINSIEGCVGSN